MHKSLIFNQVKWGHYLFLFFILTPLPGNGSENAAPFFPNQGKSDLNSATTSPQQVQTSQPVIVNHTCCRLTDIPTEWINAAKLSLHIAYGHTSHGSQLITGMTGLVGFKGTLYSFNNGGSGGALDLKDTPFSGASDLGNPNFTAWETATRSYLSTHTTINVVIWSWCGQVSGASEADINTYLSLMSGLENDFPGVKFVYMTGHLDGSGNLGNLNARNEQIRNYCRNNNKFLYDFADIESYDPDGLTHYMPLKANDNCDYDSDGNGSLDKNWALIWQGNHTIDVEWYNCSPAHTQALNGNLKAYAAWHLWARLAGWQAASPPATVQITVSTDPSGKQITVDGASYASPQTFTWNPGDSHTLSVSSPQSGGAGVKYVFTSWSDAGSQSHLYTVPGSNQSVAAYFKTQYQLTTAESPDAGGNMTPAPPGGWYDSGTSVTLDATVASGYTWSGWTGDVTGSTKPKAITMNGPKSVTANFTAAPSTKQITVDSDPSGKQITVDGASYASPQTFTWNPGDFHTLSVSSPQSGGAGVKYLFTSWSDAGSQSHAYTVPGSDQTVTAYFKTQYQLTTAENPDAGGDMTPVPPGGWYDSGTSVTLDATVASGYTWSGWTGDVTGLTKPKAITMNGPKSVTANFTAASSTVHITINTDPSGKQFLVDGTVYTSSHVFEWVPGSTHAVSMESPQSGFTGVQYAYQSWSDGGAQSHSYTVPGSNQSVTAYFKNQYRLTAAENPDAGGDMSPAPPGGWYDSGSSVTLDATVASGYTWSGWTGDISETTKPKTFTMTGPKSVTANFTVIPTTVQITVTTDPGGKQFKADGTVYTGSKTFNWILGSTHALLVESPQHVTDGSKWVFLNWTDGGAQAHDYTVPSSNQTVTVNFKCLYRLTTAENPDAGGDMTPAPPGGWYDSGASVTLDATVASGYTWSGWTGDITSTTKPKTITMGGPKSVTANFSTTVPAVQITVMAEPSGKQFSVDGTVYSSSQVFNWIPGSTHILSVESPQNVSGGTKWVFAYWTNEGVQTHVYTVPWSDKTVKAIFKCMHQLTVNSEYGVARGAGWYDAGSTAAFSVTPPDASGNAKQAFAGWSGDCSASSPSASVAMNGPMAATANWKLQYRLTVQSLYGNPQGDGWYDAGTKAAFSVSTPDVLEGTRRVFDYWSGSYSGTDPSASIALNEPKAVQAIWHTEYLLTAAVLPVSSGTLSTVPPGPWHDEAAVVTLSVTPNGGFLWDGWSGNLTGKDNPVMLTMSGPKSVTANLTTTSVFRVTTLPPGLPIRVDGSEYLAPCDFPWPIGTTHTIGVDTLVNGEAGVKHFFHSWSDGKARIHEVTADGSVLEFRAIMATQVYLSTSASPDSGGGMVPPSPGLWVAKGSVVDLIAVPNIMKGYAFSHWSGNHFGSSNPDTIVLNGPRQAVANFAVMTFALSVQIVPAGGGNVAKSPDKTGYYFGELVQLKALPQSGYVFDAWGGDATGNTNPVYVWITGNKQVTIQFKETGTAVSGEAEKHPDRFALEQNYPNPFNPETTIRFAVPETGPVRLTVCSASGQIVRNLVDATMPAGTHEVVWDGRDDQCRSASSGLYIVAMKSGLSEKRIKCILMR